MYKNREMRKAVPKHKIQADSLVEIRRGIRDEADRLADSGVKHGGVAVRPANVLNALAVWFLCHHPGSCRRVGADELAAMKAK